MPSSRPRGSATGAHAAPRVSSAPMSERQQMALVMQLTSQTTHHGTSNVSHTVTKTRDRNERGETALHVAAIKGDHEQVKKLIDQGIDPNVADFAGWTPLHEACSYGWHNIAVILIQAGANVNARGMGDDTPLHDAANNGHLKVVKYLIECGADPYLKNKKGKMPFDVANHSACEYLASLKENPPSQRIPHAGKSRDDTKKSGTGDDTATSSGYSTEIMDSSNKLSEEKNDTKETTTSVEKSVSNPVSIKSEEETSGSLNVAVANPSTTHEETPSSQSTGSKRFFLETPDSTESESVEDEGSKRKKRKDSDSSKESTKTTQQTRVSVGRNNLLSGCKPPGPASKTGVAPLSKGGATSQSSGSKSGSNSASQGKSGSGVHSQGNQSKNSSGSNVKGNAGSGQHNSQSNKVGSSNQGKSQGANLTVSQSTKGLPDKKSPCASPKPPTFNQVKDEVEAEEKTVDTPGPKVPPLKIVIPGGVGGGGVSGNQQEGEGGSTQRGNTKNRGGNSTLPYILQPSNNVSDSESSNTEGNENSSESKEEKRPSSSSDEKSGLSGQRVLRSHRNADGTEKDKDRGRNSPHISQTSNNSSSSGYGSAKSSAHQSSDNESSSSSASSSANNSSGASTSGSSGSSGNASVSGNSQIVWDGVFQVPSVDFHPRKRKIKSSKESHSHHQSSTPDSSSHASTSSGDSHIIHINQLNSYQMYINVKKQIERRQKGLFPVQPKPPQGFKDYLMNRCTYVLKSNAKQQPIIKPPQSLPPQMREEFILQENDRHYLRVQHLVEKEKLVLAVEQEILRVHGRAARALANQSLPFSVCSVLRDKEVYNMLTPEQEEKERNAQRSRYNGRLFLSWLQDVDDKWEKIKESMVKRHHTEAQSLYVSQRMSWSWRLQELGLCDYKSAPHIDQGHVPKVNVSDDFDLLPA